MLFERFSYFIIFISNKHLGRVTYHMNNKRQLPTSDDQMKRQPAPQDVQILGAALMTFCDHKTWPTVFLPLISLYCTDWPVPQKNLRLDIRYNCCSELHVGKGMCLALS